MTLPESMDEVTGVRFLSGNRLQRAKYLRSFPKRWENDSHFVRSACIVYMRSLDHELSELAHHKRLEHMKKLQVKK